MDINIYRALHFLQTHRTSKARAPGLPLQKTVWTKTLSKDTFRKCWVRAPSDFPSGFPFLLFPALLLLFLFPPSSSSSSFFFLKYLATYSEFPVFEQCVKTEIFDWICWNSEKNYFVWPLALRSSAESSEGRQTTEWLWKYYIVIAQNEETRMQRSWKDRVLPSEGAGWEVGFSLVAQRASLVVTCCLSYFSKRDKGQWPL